MFSSFLLLSLQSQLLIDPLMIVQAEEVWSVIGTSKNTVWPGWDARKTPLLFYFPGKQDVLINHPKPPSDFVLYTGPVKSKLGAIYVRNGKTHFDMDGQNTSTDIGGVRTLVVADTQSTRRQWIQSLSPTTFNQPSKSQLEQLEIGLFKNPLDSMLIVAHEAFHVFQDIHSKKDPISELTIAKYPTLSPENNAGFALESELLAKAIQAPTRDEAKQHALDWLATRTNRRRSLSSEVIGYENGVEFVEGLAKYVEYASLQALKSRKPAPAMWLNQGFEGYKNPAQQEDRMINSMKGFMSGKHLVNNDPYGTAPVRFRMYFSGMAIGAMLDRLGTQWKHSALDKGVSLTGLVEKAVGATDDQLSKAWTRLASTPEYTRLLASKRELEAAGAAHVTEVLAAFDQAPTKLVIDYSGLANPKVGLAFTAFGLLRIDEHRTVYRTIPLRGVCGDLKFAEDSARPVLMDTKTKQLHFTLTSTELPSDLALGQVISRPKIALPGVSLDDVKGTFSKSGNTLTLRLSP